MNRSIFSALTATACAAIVGCSSTPLAPIAAPIPVAAITSTAPTAAAFVKPAPTPTTSTAALPAYLDPKNPISAQRSVYFAFDDFAVKNEYRALIERHGGYLASMPNLAIRIEGNTDERGSAEYNLALGQRRAEAVRNALEIYGVKASQLEAVSWGSERPRVPGRDETSWAQNRRADLSYPKQ